MGSSTMMIYRLSLFMMLVSVGLGIPMKVVTSGKPRCTMIELPLGTDLKVHYRAPDLVLDESKPNHGPVYMTITEAPSPHRTMDHVKKWSSQHLPNPTTVELKSLEGFFLHRVQMDGIVKICIRASTAGSLNPMLFGIFVEKEDNQKNEKAQKDRSLGVDYHLSFMEAEMNRIEMAMRDVLHEANFAKERDTLFHRQTVDMHNASLFWPMVQICVLLMTGFTQATHLVRFFKSRRLV